MSLQIRTSVSGVDQHKLSRAGGSGMKGSCGGAKPLLSQCLEKVWHLDLVVLVAVSFANSGVEAKNGCLRATASCRIFRIFF